MLNSQRRHDVVAERLGRSDAAVPGDDSIVLVDQDGVVKPKALNRACNLLNLLSRMSARVAIVRPQINYSDVFDSPLLEEPRCVALQLGPSRPAHMPQP